jgi:uncharacterized membrane protein (DUF2068 family)
VTRTWWKGAAGHERHRSGVLRLIAVFRLIKAAGLLAAALGALRLMDHSVAVRLHGWLTAIPFVGQHRPLHEAVDKITTAPPRHLEIVASVAVAYAVLFAVEGLGLWTQRVWAEYLTIVATTSFIPFEIYELTRRFTPVRVGILAANAAIVVYLVVRRVRARP